MLIEHHGDDAGMMALRRAKDCLGADDLDGWSVWQRVLKAVDTLRADSGGVVH